MITKKIELFEEEKVLKCGPSFDLAPFSGVKKVLPPCSKSNEPAPCATSKTISVTPACLFHPGFMRRLFPLTGSEKSKSRRQAWKIANADGEKMEGEGGGGGGRMDGWMRGGWDGRFGKIAARLIAAGAGITIARRGCFSSPALCARWQVCNKA